MSVKKCYLLILFLFSLLKPALLLASPIFYEDQSRTKVISNSLTILEDPKGAFTFEQVRGSRSFIKKPGQVLNLGVTTSAYWVKFQVKNLTDHKDLLLELSYPTLDKVHFYAVYPSGKVDSVKTGEYLKFGNRAYNYPNYIFDLRIPKGDMVTCFLRVESKDQIMLPLKVGVANKVLEANNSKSILFGIYAGVILVMFLYNLFLFITIRDRSYFFYVVHTLCIGLTQASFQGYTFQYLWPDSPWMAQESLVLFTCMVSLVGIGFFNSFLKTREYIPRMYNISFFFLGLYTIMIIAGLLNINDREVYKIMQTVQATVSFYILIGAVMTLRKGYRPAKYYLLAWSVLMVGICIYFLKDFGVLPYNDLTTYTMPAGSALETILLSFALADRINTLKREKEESQRRAMAALEENDRMIREQNAVLDKKVTERTWELKRSNEVLEKTLKDLKEAQAQLVNSEKMASLGQLTAGMAHEINNPINFVISSVTPLKRDIGEILTVLDKYEELTENNFQTKTQEVNRLKRELDLDYIKDEIDSLLKGIDEGAARTCEIVKGLKTFSRLDELDLKAVDINEGIDSTLILLNSLIGSKIKVVKEYGIRSKVECFPGKLNQVFMNLLNNAIHAILKKGMMDGEGKLAIKTIENQEDIVIRIKDNGTGIPPHVQSRIFEPFFTTKDVGEGTGLGLSIVYTIIENHQGKIEFETEVGQGTEFIITLPKLQSNIK